jgi:hypothetical protein
MDDTLGSPEMVSGFLERALARWGRPVERDGVRLRIAATDGPGPREARRDDGWQWVMCDPHQPHSGDLVVDRTHPWVVEWAQKVLAMAWEPSDPRRVARTGAILTSAVSVRTILGIARERYRIQEGSAPDQFAEEVVVTGYQRGHAVVGEARHRSL